MGRTKKSITVIDDQKCPPITKEYIQLVRKISSECGWDSKVSGVLRTGFKRVNHYE